VYRPHDALERLLHGYNLAYNARRQRVLNGQSPDQVVQARLEAKPALANPAYQTPSPCGRTKTKIAARLTVYSAKDVSHPDKQCRWIQDEQTRAGHAQPADTLKPQLR
jgi:membrane-bound lytic murein transglycosylase